MSGVAASILLALPALIDADAAARTHPPARGACMNAVLQHEIAAYNRLLTGECAHGRAALQLLHVARAPDRPSTTRKMSDSLRAVVRASLEGLLAAIAGATDLDAACEAVAESLRCGSVPTAWIDVCYATAAPLGAWTAALRGNVSFFAGWASGVVPASFPMGGECRPCSASAVTAFMDVFLAMRSIL